MKPAEILIIDDDLGILEGLSLLLEDEGYSIAQATNGRLALDYLDANRGTRLILLDLMMPVMDGYQFREHQRQDTVLAGIPVIVLTAGTLNETQILELSAAASLKKPVEIDRLLNTIALHLKGAS